MIKKNNMYGYKKFQPDPTNVCMDCATSKVLRSPVVSDQSQNLSRIIRPSDPGLHEKINKCKLWHVRTHKIVWISQN